MAAKNDGLKIRMTKWFLRQSCFVFFLLIVKVDKTRQRKCKNAQKCMKYIKNIDKIAIQVYNNRN